PCPAAQADTAPQRSALRHPRGENALRATAGGRCNRRMGEILGHVLAVLPAFLLACLAVAALPGPSTALFLHRTVRDGRAAALAVPRSDPPPTGAHPGRDPGRARQRAGRRVPLSLLGRAHRDATGRHPPNAAADC